MGTSQAVAAVGLDFRHQEAAAQGIRRADGSEHVATHMVVAQAFEARKRIATTLFLKAVCDGQVTRLSIAGALVSPWRCWIAAQTVAR